MGPSAADVNGHRPKGRPSGQLRPRARLDAFAQRHEIAVLNTFSFHNAS
jgi:hypothetical protein